MFTWFNEKKKPLAIIAIFRNEKEYILEWLAWHKSQGIHDFVIYDNESDDGTAEILEKLAKEKLIKYRKIKRQEKAQILAYQDAIDKFKDQYTLMAFIDADEFIMPLDDKTVKNHVLELFQDKSVGALGINWKVFGSNFHKEKPEGLVIENFTMAANDTQVRNHFLKSIYRPEAVKKIFPHRAKIQKKYSYIDTNFNNMVFSHPDCLPEPTKDNQTSGVSAFIANTRLRINHYALKSEEEFINKKKLKGDAMFGERHVKSDGYFKAFNLNDFEQSVQPLHIKLFKKIYEELLGKI